MIIIAFDNFSFTDIMRALHFQNDGNIPTGNIDRFIKLGSFFPSLMSKFKNFVIPGEYLYIDESLMPFKGRLSFKQYVPSKRARFGVKFYILVDCATKAVLALLPYQGKKNNICCTEGYLWSRWCCSAHFAAGWIS